MSEPAAKVDAQFRPPSPLWDAFRGAAVGMFEVTVCGQPMVYFKNMFQQGITPSFNPLVWYRGFAVHASSMVPITALQMTTNNLLYRLLAPKNQAASEGAVAAAAVGAGAITALVASPSELVILYQQNTGTTISGAAREILQKYGVRGYLRGMPMVSLRDGIFTFGYLLAGPKVQERITRDTGSATLGMLGGCGVGVLVGVATHPFDTIKTEAMRPKYGPEYGIMNATADVYRQGGIKQFFLGAAPRTVRVAASVLIYGNLSVYLDRFRPHF